MQSSRGLSVGGVSKSSSPKPSLQGWRAAASPFSLNRLCRGGHICQSSTLTRENATPDSGSQSQITTQQNTSKRQHSARVTVTRKRNVTETESNPKPVKSKTDDQIKDLKQIPGVGAAYARILYDKGFPDQATLRSHCNRICEEGQNLEEYFKKDLGIKHKHHLNSILGWATSETVKTAPKVTLSIEGNIGAGKSTFLSLLKDSPLLKQILPHLKVIPEPVDLWQSLPAGKGQINLLDQFYQDPTRNSFLFQQYVFLTRYMAERDSYHNDVGVERVLERSVFSDRLVFVKAVHRGGQMNDAELAVYDSWFDPLLESRPSLVPDGFVYLRAEPETCHRRMQKRGRSEESGVPLPYLQELHENHETWLKRGRNDADAWHNAIQQSIPVRKRPLHAVADQLPSKLQLPKALQGDVFFLYSENQGDWHPSLNWVPALVLDYNQDTDLDKDEDYKQAIATKIHTYTEFLETHKRFLEPLKELSKSAKPSSQLLLPPTLAGQRQQLYAASA